ncbi:hypothetical protein [Geobacillus sp. YHL]|uniref:hypothetical protein n=1 Tax=Geobacillus sp. YHL TaxID=2796117 RepID=UPI001EF15722|nr:hypothetical protein [Geobacillus sp. YHL]MCG6796338.1 hypothetical protein [Geobacillus sp. YHL]
MNAYLSQGQIVLNVSKLILANSEQEAWRKINEMINVLNAHFGNLSVETVDGQTHSLNVDNFEIEWKDVSKF